MQKEKIEKYYFRLEFGIYHRYTKDFMLKKIPTLESQKILITIYLEIEENKLLYQQYGLTGFELCKL